MSEFTLARTETRVRDDTILSALTIEFAIYAALGLFALFIRLFVLDLSPLNSDEARQALASLNFAQGNVGVATGSPLLFTLNAILFLLFGASDLTARLAPALFGTGMVLLPIFFRRDLGRVGALVASALFAISPSLVFFSRSLDGVIPAMACALAAVAIFIRHLETRAARDLYVSAACGALALIASPDAWTVVLALGIYLLAVRLGAVSIGKELPSETSSLLSRAMVVFLLVFVGVSTTLLLHREGIGAALDLLGAWLDRVRFGGSPLDLLRLLFVYEPLILSFGLAALLKLFFASGKNRSMILSSVGFWIVIALMLLSFSSDNNPARVVVVVVPLALLAGSAIGAWIERMMMEVRTRNMQDLLMHEIPILLVALSLTSFLSIVFFELAQRGNILTTDVLARLVGAFRDSSEVSGVIVLFLSLVAFFATSVLAVTTLGASRARNVGVFFALLILSIWTIRQMTMLNFPSGGALNPQEWMVARAASSNVRDMKSDLENESRWRANDTHTLVVAASSSLGPLVEWSLRDFRNARFSLRPTALAEAQALVLPADAPAPSVDWIAQRYSLEMTRSGEQSNALRALIFRDVGSVESLDAVLWILKPL